MHSKPSYYCLRCACCAVFRALDRLRVSYVPGRLGAQHLARRAVHLREPDVHHVRDGRRSFRTDRVRSAVSHCSAYEIRVHEDQGEKISR